MIQVTLNFPDQAALLAFFAAPAALAPVPAVKGEPLKSTAEKVTPTKPAKGEGADKPSAQPATTAEVKADPKPQEDTTSSAKPSESVDYPTLQKAVFALAGKSRDKAAAVAGSFGVKTFKELPEAKWADALAAVNAALAEAA